MVLANMKFNSQHKISIFKTRWKFVLHCCIDCRAKETARTGSIQFTLHQLWRDLSLPSHIHRLTKLIPNGLIHQQWMDGCHGCYGYCCKYYSHHSVIKSILIKFHWWEYYSQDTQWCHATSHILINDTPFRSIELIIRRQREGFSSTYERTCIAAHHRVWYMHEWHCINKRFNGWDVMISVWRWKERHLLSHHLSHSTRSRYLVQWWLAEMAIAYGCQLISAASRLSLHPSNSFSSISANRIRHERITTIDHHRLTHRQQHRYHSQCICNGLSIIDWQQHNGKLIFC